MEDDTWDILICRKEMIMDKKSCLMADREALVFFFYLAPEKKS